MRKLGDNNVVFHLIREDNEELVQAMKLFAETFKTETITAHTYNFNHEKTEKQYYKASLLNAKLCIEQGHDILIAKVNEAIVAISIVKKTPQKSLFNSLKVVFPEAFKLFPLLTKVNYKNVVSISKTMKLSRALKEDYITLAAIAVSSNYQGQGVGKQFLNEIYQRYKNDFEAIYLYTANEKTKDIYLSVGYEVIEYKQVNHFGVYHMLYRF